MKRIYKLNKQISQAINNYTYIVSYIDKTYIGNVSMTEYKTESESECESDLPLLNIFIKLIDAVMEFPDCVSNGIVDTQLGTW